MQWFDPKTVLRFLHFVFNSFMHYEGLENAKSLTYTSLFAVVPLLTVTIVILSAFPAFQVFVSEIQETIFTRLIPTTSLEVESYIARFTSQAANITAVGAIILMVTSYLMLVTIERNFNTIWGVGELRKGFSSFLIYWSVLSLGPLLLGLGFAISSYITSLEIFEAVTEVSANVGVNTVLLNLFPIILTTLAFTLLYVAVPNCGVSLTHGLAGGITVALSFVLVKNFFTWFISLTSYELVYGTFAAMPVFLLWLYVSWVVILFGANLVRSIPLFKAQHERYNVHPTLLLLALLHKFWCNYQEGCGLKISELIEEKWPFKDIQVEEFLDLLSSKRVVRACSQDDYLLSRDLNTIYLWELLEDLPWRLPRDADLSQPLPECMQQHLPSYPVLQAQFTRLEQHFQEEFGASVDSFFRKGAPYQENKQPERIPAALPGR